MRVWWLGMRSGAAVTTRTMRAGVIRWAGTTSRKLRVKTAVNFIGEFERSLAEEARRRKVDGVICGHIHHAASRDMEGVHYVNTGDWVESCTAIGETLGGDLKLIRWLDEVRARQPVPGVPAKLKAA